eukprot:1177526-Prorocentrum_minimum.AAC.2
MQAHPDWSEPSTLLASAAALPWPQLFYTGVVTTGGCIWLEVSSYPPLAAVFTTAFASACA